MGSSLIYATNPCVTLNQCLTHLRTSGSCLCHEVAIRQWQQMATNGFLFHKITPQVCLLDTVWVLCLPSSRKSIKEPGLKFQHVPVLWKDVPADLGAALPQAGGLQDLWKRRTTPADPVWFWKRAQCSLPLTLAPREAEEQAWATLGWLTNRPVIPAQLPRSQFPFQDSLGSHALFFPNLNTTGFSGSCVHPQLLCPACQRTEAHHSVH